MAECGNVIELTFTQLRKKNIIKQDKTEILSGQIDNFDALNQFYSDVARTEFGVLNPGLMFSKYDSSSSTTGTINVSSTFGEAKSSKTYARINKEFTDEFQQKYEFFNANKQIKDADNSGAPVDYMREETLLDLINDKPSVDIGVALKNVALLQNQARANEMVIKMAEKLSTQTGIPYEIIDADLARALLQNTAFPYNNEPGFTFNGKAYFVQEFMTINTVFHEFSHPIVQAIAKGNLTLFNNLFSILENTPEGKEIIEMVKRKYPEHASNPIKFKEECIVRGIEKDASNIRHAEEGVNNKSEGFAKFIKEIMYQIKQFFRKTFGRVRVEKLKSTTTINELANMLINNDFQLNSIEISDKDIVDYARANDAILQELYDKVDTNEDALKVTQLLTNDFLATARKQSGLINTFQNKELAKEIADRSNGGGLMGRINSDLSKYATTNFTEETSYARNQLDVGGQCIAFTNSLATLDAIIDIINKHLSEAKNSTDASHDVINKTQYYNSLLDDWALFADRTLKDLNSVGLTRTTALHTLVTRIKEGAEEGKEMFKELQQKTAIDATMSVLKEYNEKLNENYKAEIKRIEDIIAKKSTKTALAVLEETKKKWEEDKITEEKIKAMYKGELGDTSWWAGMFLSYTDSSDPIIGGFALYLKNNLSILQNNVIRKIDNFNKIIRPMLKELGITNTNVRKEWAFALYQDKAHKYTKGVLTERAAWAFLSSTKDYAFDVAKVDQDVDDARTELSKIDINDPDKQIEGLKKLKDALKTRETLLNTYFNRENISEVYEAESQLLNTPEGVMAFEAKTVALDALYKASLGDRSELETYEKYDVITAAVKAYSQLFNIKNEDGSSKTNNPGSAKWEDNKLAVAEALQAHRERTRKYYEWLPIKGAFDKSLSNFEDELRISQPNLTEDEITAKVESWINRNTVVGYTDEYYQITNDAWTLLKELKAKLPADIASAEDTSDLFSSLSAIINMNKDELGQPDGTVVKPNVVKIVKDLQEQLNHKYDEYSLAAFGLTLDEYEEFIELRNLDDEGEPLNPMERIQLKQYMETMKEFRSKVPTSLVFAITSTVNKLVSLKGKVPTSHYLDQINELLSNIPGTALLEEETAKEALNLDYISQVTWVNPTDTPEVKLAKEKFSTWYLENHVQKSFFNKNIGKKVTKYERLNIWSISKPKDPKYYQTTEITRNGKTTSINRIPSLKFKFRVVKNEFRTIPFGLTAEERNKYVGTVIDNKGNFLPKNMEQGAPVDSPYVNKAYYDLKKNNPKQFELLEAIKEWHLENQIGVARPDKLYMELPRYLQEDLEAYQSGQKYTRARDTASAIAAGAKALVTGKGLDAANKASAQEGDFENNLANPNAIDEDLDTVRFVNQSLSNPYTDRLPVKGISNLSVDDTSLNVLKALNTYAYHTEKQRLFNQINPVAKAIVETLEDTNNAIKNMQQKQGTHATDRNIWNPSGSDNIRAGIARALYDREFKGDIYSGGHLDFLNKITSGIMHAASFNYFALNIPSAIKNYWGALMQANLEAIAGEHMNLMTMGKGKLWGKQAMIDWAQRIYGADNRSLNNQMIMFFDPAEGKAEESVIKDTSRTYLSDVASMTWLYSPRKFMEMEASLQLFASMMYFKKVIRTVNGVETLIPYMEAFELDGKGDMVLKEGVDQEYDINGVKFLAFKNLVHQKHKELNGTFAKFEKPQAQGHFAYRLIMFMRGYFTSMFMNRFGSEKNNFVTGQKTAGYYIDSLKGMARVMTTMGDYMPLMPARERRAIRKLLTEFGQIAVISIIVSLFFGYNDKDPERFAKLREKSGPLGADDFHFWGFLSNQSLSLLLKTQNENESLIPLPGYGLNDYTSMANAGSIAFNPTVKQYARIINDAAKMMAPGDDPSTVYQRDMGPYPWQKAGSEKIWTHFAGIFGITGKDVQPIGGIKTLEMIRRGM